MTNCLIGLRIGWLLYVKKHLEVAVVLICKAGRDKATFAIASTLLLRELFECALTLIRETSRL